MMEKGTKTMHPKDLPAGLPARSQALRAVDGQAARLTGTDDLKQLADRLDAAWRAELQETCRRAAQAPARANCDPGRHFAAVAPGTRIKDLFPAGAYRAALTAVPTSPAPFPTHLYREPDLDDLTARIRDLVASAFPADPGPLQQKSAAVAAAIAALIREMI